jgi:hypothetical protein
MKYDQPKKERWNQSSQPNTLIVTGLGGKVIGAFEVQWVNVVLSRKNIGRGTKKK